MTDELTLFRADVPPADQVAMAKARATLVREATGGHRARARWQVGITVAAVAAVAAAVFALPSAATKTPPAAVQGVVHNPDGTITIKLREVDDILATNMELYNAGVRAVILDSGEGGVVECWTMVPVTPSNVHGAPADVVLPRPNPWGDVLTFRPDRIPENMWLYIQAMVESPGNKEVQYRCDPGQQWEMAPGWIGDTTSGYPNLPPRLGAQPSTSSGTQPPSTGTAPSDQVSPNTPPARWAPVVPPDQPEGPVDSPTRTTPTG